MLEEPKKEYFVIPGLEIFSVSKDGEVIDTKTRKVVEQRMSGDYKCVNALGESWHVHRLMANTFLPSDVPTDELDVNHKDTNKLNNTIDNLEWVTRSGNCVHALENGLWTTATPVLVKDLRTGDVARYYGLNACARAHGVNPALINYYLKDSSKVRMSFFVFINEGQEWPDLTLDDALMQSKSAQKVSVAVNVETNEILVFSNIKSAAAYIGVPGDTLGMHIRRYGEKPYHGYSFRLAKTTDEILVGLARRKKSTFKPVASRKPLPILVKNKETGVEETWDSTEDFAKHVGAKWNTVRTAISRKGGWGNYEISYKTHCPLNQ